MLYYRLYIILSFKPPFGKRHHTAIMEQDLQEYDSSLKDTNGKIMTKRINKFRKSNKCKQCDFPALDKINLRRHLKAHSGEKPNKCNQCNFASSQASNLRTHLKMHSGEKPNKCNQCDYASSQAGHLRAHLKTHRLDFDRQLGQLTSCLVPVLYPPHNPVPRE